MTEYSAHILSALADTQSAHGQSRWNCLATCEMLHELRYVRGLEKKRLNVVVATELKALKPKALEVGSACHAVIRYASDAEKEGRSWGDLDDVLAAGVDLGNWSSIDAAEAGRLMVGYWDRWSMSNAGWHRDAEILECESLYEDDNELGGHTCRLDTLLRLRDRLVIVDTKTRATRVNDSYAVDMSVRPQFLGQAWHVRKRHGSLPRLVANVIVKTKSPDYDRVPVEITDEMVDRWAMNQKNVANRHEALTTNSAYSPYFPRLLNYDACVSHFGDRCEFFDWCHNGSSAVRESLYVKKETSQYVHK